ncbi:glycosyltransferase [Streptomyces botrytidirepellens]|uniref:Glycosyltransferase n=1 Tax=Streptomyces botrytidirepellens TaxID=2486417 RepID=A0A3M8WEF2_9ACTN|nr:glycosyltransferase [Streptomyces botrytidirepellens]RNG26955.1 glycosyltransferase [Streptomyces botrytidirepellens]
MRVLCTTTGSASHGRAQLPLLRALAAAGHEVLVVTNSGLAPVFQDDDVRVTTVMPDLDPRARMQEQADEMANLPQGDTAALHSAMGRLMFRGMAGAGAKISLEAVFPTAKEFQPDLILRDGMDMGACLIAERLGIPHLPTPSGAVNILDPADVLPYLNGTREEVGLPTHDDPLSIAPHGRVDCVPPEFTFARNLPPTFSYRQTVDVERASVLPRWVAELPTDRPLVYAAIGTALPKMLEMGGAEGGLELPPGFPDPTATLRTIADAVSRLEDCTVVLTTSGVPLDTDGLPPHVHVTERLPQPILLESVDVFLTHGGFNSIRESLRTATPLAVLPQFGDQHANARRVEELGLGRHVTDTTPEGVAAVCRDVLADDAITARARTARLTMLATPGIETAVGDLEKLAG